MYRVLAIALVLCLVAPAATPQEPVPIGKDIDIGPLAAHFTLLSGDVAYPMGLEGFRVTLRLRATKDVDTADLHCQAGFFDKGKHLMQASPLQFEAGFPLLKGESINAYCFCKLNSMEGLPWHMIYIRPGKKPN